MAVEILNLIYGTINEYEKIMKVSLISTWYFLEVMKIMMNIKWNYIYEWKMFSKLFHFPLVLNAWAINPLTVIQDLTLHIIFNYILTSDSCMDKTYSFQKSINDARTYSLSRIKYNCIWKSTCNIHIITISFDLAVWVHAVFSLRKATDDNPLEGCPEFISPMSCQLGGHQVDSSLEK